MVAAQVGVGFLPTHYYSPLLASGVFREIALEPEMPQLDYYLTYRRSDNTPLLRAVRRAVHKTCNFRHATITGAGGEAG